MSQRAWRVYVLEAWHPSRVTLHVGIALDVQLRIYQHKRGEVKATRGRDITWLGNSGPMEHGDALRLEAKLKRLPPSKKREWAAQQVERPL